jgi:diacylglycerol kinase (CTP)
MGQVTMSQFRISSQLRLRSDLHIARKVWHITTGLVGLLVYKKSGATTDQAAALLFALALAAFSVEFLRLNNEKINQVLTFFMKPVMRESERTSVSGLPFYALGVSLALFFFPERIAILATLFLIFADPIASFFGILYGRDKILPNKSLQGTIAAFSVCYIVTIVYGLFYVGPSMNLLVFAIAAGVIGSISEMCSQFVDDNLCIPVVSGLGLYLVNLVSALF